MKDNDVLFTIGLTERLENLYQEGFDNLYQELSLIGVSIENGFDEMSSALYNRGIRYVVPSLVSYDMFREYRRAFGHYVEVFNRMTLERVNFEGVDLQNFLEQAWRLREFDDFRTNTQLRMMQQYCIMKQVAGFIYQLYVSLVDRHRPVFKYMQDGAQLLGYTDKKMFEKMYNAIRKKNKLNLAEAIIRAMFGGNRVYPKECFEYYEVGKGAAVADYPYTFTSLHDKPLR